MNKVRISIDGREFIVPEGLPVRKAALKNGIYIPGICGHPYLPPAAQTRQSPKVFRGAEEITASGNGGVFGETANCNLCLVKIEGEPELQRACETKAVQGLIVHTNSEEISRARKKSLAKILAHHPHACLTCAQREGCSLTQCSSNVPEDERCCILLNRCELGKIVDYIGLPDNTPKYVPENFPKLIGDPFFDRDYNLCIGCLRCVRVCADVRGVEALAANIHDDRIWVGTSNPGLLAESYCKFCGACVEVCPTGALRDKPDSKPVHHGENPPCVDACPAGIDIPAYLRRIALGDFAGALEVIYRSVPFPGILGYVCFHPCESACKRETLDESISICALKRYAYENAPETPVINLETSDPTGKKIAVAGSGPAGLTAAFYLRKAGHDVDVFDAADKPGGMLRYAIPEYRLPEEILDDELKPFHDLGVNFKTGMKLGEDVSLEQLKNDYDAILVSIGTGKSKSLAIPGADLPEVVTALELLKDVRTGNSPKLTGKTVVIGGGNVAIDSAMTARRLGSEDTVMVCLEQRDEMPAHTWELKQAAEEGVKVSPGWGPVEFLSENGQVTGVKFKKCSRVFDANGKFAPRFDESETMEVKADNVILAVGQEADLGNISSDIAGMAGSAGLTAGFGGVFAAGDVVRGPGSVIDAIADGKKVADSIDRYLGGEGISFARIADPYSDDPKLGRDENIHHAAPVKPGQSDPSERITGFTVIEQTFSAENAVNEALRCLRCNLRASITPVFLPPDKWQILTTENIDIIPSEEGVIQIAGRDKKVTKIAGSQNIHSALQDELAKYSEEMLFCWEADKMYSKRENELLQQYLQQYGEMPGGGGDDDLDDLF